MIRRRLRRWLGVSLLADELNQFAMEVESIAWRHRQSAEARLNQKEIARWGALMYAARRLRYRVSELIEP